MEAVENNAGVVFEFRTCRHVVRLFLRPIGGYAVEVEVLCRGSKLDAKFVVAEVIERDLAVHCFNHTVQQYQKDAE